MPELPEVETLRRDLEQSLVGRRITTVRVFAPKILQAPVTEPEELVAALTGKRVENVRRRGKYLIFGLSCGYALLSHLNMRGQMRLAARAGDPPAKALCLAIDLDDGKQWRYHDLWGWGQFRLLLDNTHEFERYVPALKKMGVEPLSEEFSASVFKESAMRREATTIKACLLDQAVVAGVGNIYADESLYRARIRPERRVRHLSDQDWRALTDAVRLVLTEAVTAGGTRSEEFVNTAGAPGRYEPLAYGRAKLPCLNCGEALSRITITGRGTVYCPNCQV